MKWTLTKAANEFKVNRDTVKKGLVANGIKIEKYGVYTTLQIHLALTGDLKAERTRETKANADKAEVEAAIAKREVISTQLVAQFISETFNPVREQVLALPGALCAQVNPSDPTHAREHLQIWADQFLKHCREHKPKMLEQI